MGAKINEVGNRYGRLTVIKQGSNIRNRCGWICRCDCGNERNICGSDLRSGKTLSCGCLVSENLKLGPLALKGRSSDKIINEVGNRYGRLVVLEKVESINGRAAWKCQCDCGNTVIVKGKYLRNGDTKSCGCLSSYGELRIAQILRENNIDFEKEKKFDTCIFKEPCRFDFYVNDKYLIECDGIQHFKLTGWRSPEEFELDQQRDQYKNEWCIEHNIPLIRIPYNQIDNLTMKDLDVETSKFLVT